MHIVCTKLTLFVQKSQRSLHKVEVACTKLTLFVQSFEQRKTKIGKLILRWKLLHSNWVFNCKSLLLQLGARCVLWLREDGCESPFQFLLFQNLWCYAWLNSLEFQEATTITHNTVHKLKCQEQEVKYKLWPTINKYTRSKSLFQALKMFCFDKYQQNSKTLSRVWNYFFSDSHLAP